MSVSVVIGGQFGSEGKGKVAYYFAQKLGARAMVRVGGTNSGHIVINELGESVTLRSLPTSAINKDIMSIIPSGAYIDMGILLAEIKITGISSSNLKIDPYAVVITEDMKTSESNSWLRDKIGSTLSGTGQAVIKRLQRLEEVTFAKDKPELVEYIADTKFIMREMITRGEHIVIEGTQGFGLSPINSTFYPFCTSRDTTAAAFVMESGLSPLDVENVIMVVRAHPIRVGGNSGDMYEETSWDEITEQSGCPFNLTELTSATKRVRRVGKFDSELVKRALLVNNPNIVVLNHLDYVDFECHDKTVITSKAKKFVRQVEESIHRKIDYVGVGRKSVLKVGEQL